MNKSINIQDTFLNQLRKENIPATVYLTNGFQIRGIIKAFDNFTIVIDSDGRQQMATCEGCSFHSWNTIQDCIQKGVRRHHV